MKIKFVEKLTNVMSEQKLENNHFDSIGAILNEKLANIDCQKLNSLGPIQFIQSFWYFEKIKK